MSLLKPFQPTKPPFDTSIAVLSASTSNHHIPQQVSFDSDFYKFMIDSGASTHMWNC